MTLYIDADACPVKDEAERVATRLRVRMVLVSNGGYDPRRTPWWKASLWRKGRMRPISGSLTTQGTGMWW